MRPNRKWMAKLFEEEMASFHNARDDWFVLPGFLIAKHYVAGPYLDYLNAETQGNDDDLWLDNGQYGYFTGRSASFGEGVTSYKGQAVA